MFWEEERREGFQRPPSDDQDAMGFNVFTNPMEMQRYFQQQINELINQLQMEDHSFFGGE